MSEEEVVVGAVFLLQEVFPAAHHLCPVARLAPPDRQRGAPISFAGKSPILNVSQPFPEPPLFQVGGNPVDFFVVLYNLLLEFFHSDEPGITGVIEQRSLTSPAEGIIVLVNLLPEEDSPLLQIPDNQRVCFLKKHAGPFLNVKLKPPLFVDCY